jgi:pantoate--beta-alanine ligase
MRTVRTVAELRAALSPCRREDRSVGFVPTMGAFHDGHLALMARARQECDFVVVSLFVNPSQFDDGSDLAAYPADEERDSALAAQAGVDVLFAPTVEEVYPPGFATSVTVAGLSEPLEGDQRGASHFTGVATVVLKLLNMVGPDVAFFGQKDAQQALIVRRLVHDLDVPVRVEVVPTVREPDGLAMSSRNVRLDASERARAAALSQGLSAGAAAVAAGARERAAILAAARHPLELHDVQPEYLELVSTDTLAPVERLDGEALLAVAARVGSTRLIDNATLRPTPNGRSH